MSDLINGLASRLLADGFQRTIPGQFCKPNSHERVRTNYVHGEWTVTVRDAFKSSTRYRVSPSADKLPGDLLAKLVSVGLFR